MINIDAKLFKYICSISFMLIPSFAISSPSEVADFSTSTAVLSIPFVKVNGNLTFKNTELFLNLETKQFEIRNIKEIFPNDIINIEKNISLAQGSSEEVTFSGFKNLPILINTERNSGSRLIYSVRITDSSGFIHLNAGSLTSGLRKISFTPTIDDVFTIRFKGEGSSGSLNIKGTVLTTGAVSLRNQVQNINREEGKKGILARDAFDEYSYNGSANTPIIIRTQRSSGSLTYTVKIFDSTGTLVLKKGSFSSGVRKTSFTPTTNSNYIIRIEGTGSFGSYVLSIVNL